MQLEGRWTESQATMQSICSKCPAGTLVQAFGPRLRARATGRAAFVPPSAFGHLHRRDGAAGGNRKGYAGYEFDSVLAYSIWHVRNRVLDSDLGRWTRRDPVGYLDGPNRYSALRSNPLTMIDIAGLSCAVPGCSGSLTCAGHMKAGCKYKSDLSIDSSCGYVEDACINDAIDAVCEMCELGDENNVHYTTRCRQEGTAGGRCICDRWRIIGTLPVDENCTGQVTCNGCLLTVSMRVQVDHTSFTGTCLEHGAVAQ